MGGGQGQHQGQDFVRFVHLIRFPWPHPQESLEERPATVGMRECLRQDRSGAAGMRHTLATNLPKRTGGFRWPHPAKSLGKSRHRGHEELPQTGCPVAAGMRHTSDTKERGKERRRRQKAAGMRKSSGRPAAAGVRHTWDAKRSGGKFLKGTAGFWWPHSAKAWRGLATEGMNKCLGRVVQAQWA